MAYLVSAQAVAAGSLFFSTKYSIPDYQRHYKWEREQVLEFLEDLGSAKEADREYFLGLIITTMGESGREELVDGQQRMLTLTLLVNCLRIQALMNGRIATAESLKQTYLFALDEQDESELLRVLPSNEADRKALEAILRLSGNERVEGGNSRLYPAHNAIMEELERLLADSGNVGIQIAIWARWIKEMLLFVRFRHPDAGAAYNVFIVVNTRGMDLTASEILKVQLMGIGERAGGGFSKRWLKIESQLEESTDEPDVMTSFVRHVYMLDHGFVLTRDLFDEVSSGYTSEESVSGLMAKLEAHLESYLALVNPVEYGKGRPFTTAAQVLRLLGIKMARPFMLAMDAAGAEERDYERFVAAIMSKWASSGISTNVDEPKLVRWAQELASGEKGVGDVLDGVEADFKADEDRVSESLSSREVTKTGQARVLLAMADAGDALPELEALLRQPRRVYGKKDALIEADDVPKELENRIGNWGFDREEELSGGDVAQGASAADAIEARTSWIVESLLGAWYGK